MEPVTSELPDEEPDAFVHEPRSRGAPRTRVL